VQFGNERRWSLGCFDSSFQARAVWTPVANTCVISGTDAFRWGILINLVVDVSLLCIMFVGVLHKKNATYLWRMLYLQSIFWILTAVVTEVPSVVSTDVSFIVSRAI
jgi:hypothetical protein